MILTADQVTLFQDKIFSWWEQNKRNLPWRHTNNPYHILVSEVMLQQTQVSRVIVKYVEFLDRFPTLIALAEASAADVIKVWHGLGYNRRALYLHRVSIQLKNSQFPILEDDLLKLPGIGLYTARAIQIFAYKKDVAAVDTNIRQIIETEFFSAIPQDTKTIQAVADQLVPPNKSWEWHQALMDYGALAHIRQKKITKPSIKFTDTNRFLRGRIVDLLRIGPLSKQELITNCADKYAKSADKVITSIQSLEKDRLIKLVNSLYSLP